MLVYKQYTLEALNRQYNNRLQVPDFATHLEHWETWSRQAEKNFPAHKNIAYGTHPREQMDIYPSAIPRSKTLVFIHGGYWQRFDKSSFQFVAGSFHSYNLTIAILNYPLAPTASINEIVASCRKAMNWLAINLATFNGDGSNIYIAGHSAGAHLATMLMTAGTEPPMQNAYCENIKGVCALSGLFNLEPIRISEVNDGLKMDTFTALENSPVQLKLKTICPLLLRVGEDETDEFKAQSDELYQSWKKHVPVNFSTIAGVNHFSILASFCDPLSSLHKDMCRFMEIIADE